MQIYQPMLFVGLGGTGVQIGMELERRLREEICGPTGTHIAGKDPFQALAEFELPNCLQFVYADLEQNQLELVKRSWPNRTAGENTASFAHNILPTQHSYWDVSRSLRGLADPELWKAWLPGPEREPEITPLLNGAGQLPTVARAALFETLRQNSSDNRTFANWNAPLRQAFARLGNSRGSVTALSGRPVQDVIDVFVAFSVAGGTGCGIFYDFLHFAAEATTQLPGWTVRIYPLVVMPSAFEGGKGGGRTAELNGGNALLDLFRLVDACNRGHAPHMAYPPDTVAQITTGLKTAFLFSATAGLSRDDLHRSIVTLILSLIGTALDEGDAADAAASPPGSFADRFINSHVQLGQPSTTGIGNRSVSTAAVASLTIPHERIATILVNHLLARALRHLDGADSNETNAKARLQFVTGVGLDDVRSREAPPVLALDTTVRGADEIYRALSDQGGLRVRALDVLAQQLRTRRFRFDWTKGVEALAQSMDLFRVHRVIFGDPSLEDEKDKTGVIGFFERVAVAPPPPAEGLGAEPPALPPMANQYLGMKQLKWTQPPVPGLVQEQEEWYVWRAEREWSAAWAKARPEWGQIVGDMRNQLGAIVDGFRRFSASEPSEFREACADLYKPRQGVKFFLPDAGPDLSNFYDQLLGRLRQRFGLDPARPEDDILTAALGVDGWREAFAEAHRLGSPAKALQLISSHVETVVKEALSGQDQQPPLLPRLLDLLEDAANNREGHMLTAALGSLLPGGFEPQGPAGRAHIQVSYPSYGAGRIVETFLREALGPRFGDPQVEFKTTTIDSVAVILSKHAMGITDVKEVQQLVRKWSAARVAPKQEDLLKWRQRLGYTDEWLLTSVTDRTRILHRFLNALWDDCVSVKGDMESPHTLSILLREGAIPITLQLEPFRQFSSWPSLLAAYERYVIGADPTQLEATASLMEYLPTGLRSEVNTPSPAYKSFLSLSRQQPALIERELTSLSDVARHRAQNMVDFWRDLLDEAFATPFELEGHGYKNLCELHEKFAL